MFNFAFGMTIGFLIAVFLQATTSIFSEATVKDLNGKVYVSFHSGMGHTFDGFSIKDGQFYSVGNQVSIKTIAEESK